VHEERLSDSPHIQFVWRAHAQSSGSFEDIAHDFWVLVFRTLNGKTEVRLTGPVTKSQTITYEKGQVSWGIVFKAHVFIFDLPKEQMLNSSTQLPMASAHSFLLGKHEIALPSYEEAENFVQRCIDKGIINANLSIAKALSGGDPPMSERTLQRHFLNTTGVTQNKSQQITRARKAFVLLQEGKSIDDVVYEAGYADQAHLTRSLKLLSGQTPKQIIHAFRN
jgi:hypothetical protein